ncbi:MAG: SDR family oxidoreductase [Capsulimonadales bacterium]|nr:SDR family oxidoreductase [Capsulimonadales bacterium]
MADKKLDGRTAIITGAAYGIGAAISREFLRDGARVVLTDLRAEELASLVDELRSGFGDRVLGFPGDIRDDTLQQKLVDAGRERFGGPDLLVNNAANQTTRRIEETTPEHWRDVHSVNVEAPVQLIRKALPYLRPGSAIVNIASVLGEVALTGRIAYQTSKSSMIGMTRSLAVELGPRGIRVNAILPGHIMSMGEERWRAIHTERTRRLFPTSYPLRRVGRPEEIGRVAVFLASDDASFITGQSLRADGGMTILCPEEAVFLSADAADEFRDEAEG